MRSYREANETTGHLTKGRKDELGNNKAQQKNSTRISYLTVVFLRIRVVVTPDLLGLRTRGTPPEWAALTSTLHWFETELLTRVETLVGLMAVNRDVIGRALQQRLVKTGGRLVEHARYDWVLPAESHLTRRLFESMLRRIWALPVPTG